MLKMLKFKCSIEGKREILADFQIRFLENQALQDQLWIPPGGSDSKASAYNAGDLGLIPGLGRSSGKGNNSPFQYESHGQRGAQWAIVQGVDTKEKDY